MKFLFQRHVRRLVAILSCLLSLGYVNPANAGGLHIAASVGYLNTEQNGIDNSHGNFLGSATVGVEVLGLVIGKVYAEFERTKLLDEGDWNGQDYKYSSDGLYLALRTMGPVYAIGRVGYVKAEFDEEMRTVVGDRDEAISIGLGYDVGLRNELIYTHIEHEGDGVTDMISFLIGF